MGHSSGRITLQGIEAFVATATAGSVSAAARSLGSSPSAISQHISGLEAALGAALIDRTTRPVSLTPAGQIFRRRAQAILFEAQQARAEVAAQDLSSLTDLRLGMIEDFDADVTPRLLTDIAEDLRTCHFLLETGASHHLSEQLAARALDMVVAAETGPCPDWAESHALLREPFIAAVPRGALHPAGDRLAQLTALPLIQYTQRHHMGRQIAAHLARQNLTLAQRFELDSYHAILAMVAAGAGWTILTPLGYLRAQRFHDQVDVLPLPFSPLSRTITL
uniref:LysR family transcriptional regulator n=1 Tax=Actibacterium sp. TaxID=1872125 RepID=UPI00356633F4